MQERQANPLNKDVFIVCKPLCEDRLGNTVFENDVVQVKNELKIAVNLLASKENAEDLTKGIVIGNKFQGLTVSKDFLAKNNLIMLKTDDKKSKEVKGLSDIEKIEAGICPVCDSRLIFQDGCNNCPDCGFSACGI